MLFIIRKESLICHHHWELFAVYCFVYSWFDSTRDMIISILWSLQTIRFYFSFRFSFMISTNLNDCFFDLIIYLTLCYDDLLSEWVCRCLFVCWVCYAPYTLYVVVGLNALSVLTYPNSTEFLTLHSILHYSCRFIVIYFRWIDTGQVDIILL